MFSMKHTKSPSGRTHRLTEPRSGLHVEIRYRNAPQYDDQVQGDLARKFTREIHPIVLGMVPVHVDATLLDAGQIAPSLDYLKGYLAGLTATETGANRTRVIRETREQISKLRAK